MRPMIPVAVAAALLLTGCSGNAAGGASNSTAEDCAVPGDASKSIEVTGEPGTELELTSKTPVDASELQRSVLIKGEGESPEEGDEVTVSFSLFNGANGELLQVAPESPATLDKTMLADWAYEALRCSVPDQRAALVMPITDYLGDYTPEDAGFTDITTDDSIVVVLDFGQPAAALDEADILDKAEGEAKDAPAGFPEVTLDEDGAPTITIPKDAKAPEELSIATIIEGDGPIVVPGDKVYVNYRGVIWRTGEEFDSSWSRGSYAEFSTNQVIGGFQEALEGQKVGSQVISVVPAEDGGYGADWLEQNGYERDDVMVFVLDILGTVS